MKVYKNWIEFSIDDFYNSKNKNAYFQIYEIDKMVMAISKWKDTSINELLYNPHDGSCSKPYFDVYSEYNHIIMTALIKIFSGLDIIKNNVGEIDNQFKYPLMNRRVFVNKKGAYNFDTNKQFIEEISINDFLSKFKYENLTIDKIQTENELCGWLNDDGMFYACTLENILLSYIFILN